MSERAPSPRSGGRPLGPIESFRAVSRSILRQHVSLWLMLRSGSYSTVGFVTSFDSVARTPTSDTWHLLVIGHKFFHAMLPLKEIDSLSRHRETDPRGKIRAFRITSSDSFHVQWHNFAAFCRVDVHAVCDNGSPASCGMER
ncbi:hypothetical protein AC1031_021978 [Aphanomyces cochlioides]|nr:hypothetical protein AC1031_021978 [Aphanomyces cochlioides]